jgi:hypothetical protein
MAREQALTRYLDGASSPGLLQVRDQLRTLKQEVSYFLVSGCVVVFV